MMSKMFGLDWKKYEAGRISTIMYVHSQIAEHEEREANKAKRK